jgi:hypothetical protein
MDRSFIFSSNEYEEETMKKTTFLLVLLLLSTALFADLEDTVVSIPVFKPDSDAVFASRFADCFSQFSGFFYFDAFGELIYIPGGAAAVHDTASSDALARGAASLGAMFPLGNYLSGIASFTLVLDHPYIAQSVNFFTGAGLFGHYSMFGLGLFAGYYRDYYQELQEDGSGVYRGIIDDQPAEITNAVRFMFIPKIGLNDTIFFLDEIGALFSFTEKSSLSNLLAKLAFSTLELGAMSLGIDLYYEQNKYNLFLEQKSLGAKFETKHLSVEAGYRWFEDGSNNRFLSNYKDGMYARAIVKFPVGGVNALLSYGFEHSFEVIHFIGLGFSLPLSGWTNDYFYEFGANSAQNMRFSGVNLTSLEP